MSNYLKLKPRGVRTVISRFIVVSALLATTSNAYAQASIPNPLGEGTTLTKVIERFVEYALLLLTPLSIIMVLLTGFLYMTSGGSEERVKQAHRMLVWTIIGIALVLLSQMARLIIESVLGVQ